MTETMSYAGPLQRVSSPSGRIVSPVEVRRQCRIDDDLSADDALLDGLLEAATEFCENEVNGQRQFLSATYDMPLPYWWDCGAQRFPRPPLQAVVSVSYYDDDDTLTTWASTNFLTRTPWRQPGEIELAPGITFPVASSDRRYPVTIRFVAGYASPITLVSIAADTLTVSGRTYAAGDVVELSNSGGALPGGLAPNTNYYVVNPSGATIQLAVTSGGAAIDITSTGSGLNYIGKIPATVRQAVLLVVGHWYMHREAVGQSIGTAVEMAVASLLLGEEWGSY